MGFWPIILNVLKNSDVILLLIDARMPEVTKNSEIINKVERMKNKQLIFVFNKSDLIKSKDLIKLKKKYLNAFFISATKKFGVKKLKTALKDMADNWKKPSLRVGLVGYPNIGKSTLINLLAPGTNAKVSSVSGTTKKTQWVRAGNLRIIDCPGVIPFTDKKIQIGLTASKNPHKITNPEKVAIRIIEFLMEQDKKILEKKYNAKGDTPYELFENIAREKKLLIKGNRIDENRTAIKIINDWQKGQINLK